MDERTVDALRGRRVLVVEDEHLVALALVDDLEDAGAVVVGPAATVEGALGLIETHEIDVALLDIQLQSMMCFPVAEALTGKGVPFLFTTGFDAGVLPEEYAHVPKCEKPVSFQIVLAMLAALVSDQRPIQPS